MLRVDLEARVQKTMSCHINKSHGTQQKSQIKTFDKRKPEVHLDLVDYTTKADMAIKRYLLKFQTPLPNLKYEIDNRTYRFVPKSGMNSMDRGTANLASVLCRLQACLMHTPVSSKNIGVIRSLHLAFRYSTTNVIGLWRSFTGLLELNLTPTCITIGSCYKWP